MKASKEHSKSALESNEVWICADCSLERGYHWPETGHVHEKIGSCDMCGKKGVVFDKDDLLPGWEK